MPKRSILTTQKKTTATRYVLCDGISFGVKNRQSNVINIRKGGCQVIIYGSESAIQHI